MRFRNYGLLYLFLQHSVFAGKEENLSVVAKNSLHSLISDSQLKPKSPQKTRVPEKSFFGQCCQKLCQCIDVRRLKKSEVKKSTTEAPIREMFFENPQKENQELKEKGDITASNGFPPRRLGKNGLAYLLSFLLPKDIVNLAQTSSSWHAKLCCWKTLRFALPPGHDSVLSWRILSPQTTIQVLDLFFKPHKPSALTKSILQLYDLKLFLGLDFIEFLYKKGAEYKRPFPVWEKTCSVLKELSCPLVFDFSLFFRSRIFQKTIFHQNQENIFSFFRYLPELISWDRCFDIRISSPYKDTHFLRKKPLLLNYIWDISGPVSEPFSLSKLRNDLDHLKGAIKSLEASEKNFFLQNESFFKSCPNFRMLMCVPISFLQYGVLENKWKNLEKIEIQFKDENQKKESEFLAVLPHFKCLKSIVVHNVYDVHQNFLKRFPLIESLESFQAWRSFCFWSHDNVHAFIKKQVNLQTLNLGSDFYFDDSYPRFEQMLKDYCRNRKKIKLFIAFRKNESIPLIMQALESLPYLNQCSICINDSQNLDQSKYNKLSRYLSDLSVKREVTWKISKSFVYK